MKTIFLIIITGFLFAYNANAQYGSIDLSFNGTGYNLVELSNGVYLTSEMLILPDNRILVAGRRGTSLGTSGFPVLMRFNTDGSLDDSFGTNGISDIDWMEFDDFIHAIIVSSDNHIYLAGEGSREEPNGNSQTQGVGILAKLSFDGIPVSEFGVDGLFILSDDFTEDDFDDYSVTNIAEDINGEFIICGVITSNNKSNSIVNFIGKITSSGEYSVNFNQNYITSFEYSNNDPSYGEKPMFIKILDDGSVLLAGQAPNSEGTLGLVVSKFSDMGIFDSNFGNAGVSWNSDIWGSALSSFDVLADGSMLLAADGDFGYPGSPTKVFKINADGSADATFGENGMQFYNFDYSDFSPSTFYDLKPTEGGFFVVEKVLNPPLFAPIGYGIVIAKCNYDGSLDNSFGIDGKTYFIPTMQIQPARIDIDNAGRIVVCGNTTNPSFNFFVARFNGVPDNVEEYENGASLQPYPNPSSGLVNLNLMSPAQVRIFDLKGALVMSVFSNGIEPIDLHELPTGFYAIQAISENIVHHGKLIIE